MARVFTRVMIHEHFTPVIAVEWSRPARRIKYKDADNPVEKASLPLTDSKSAYVGFITATKSLDIGVAASLGDRRGFYLTFINKP